MWWKTRRVSLTSCSASYAYRASVPNQLTTTICYVVPNAGKSCWWQLEQTMPR